MSDTCHVYFLEFAACLRVVSMTPCWCCRVCATYTPIHVTYPCKSAYIDKGVGRYQAQKDLAELGFSCNWQYEQLPPMEITRDFLWGL